MTQFSFALQQILIRPGMPFRRPRLMGACKSMAPKPNSGLRRADAGSMAGQNGGGRYSYMWLPVWHSAADDYRDASTPFGTNAHLQNFLTQHARDWHRRLEVLQRLTEQLGPNSTALHNALRLLSLLKRHLHLFRVLPWAALRGWAQELDDSTLRFIGHTLRIDAWPLSATHVLRGPIGAGGLGFASLVDEVSVNFLASSLALRFHSHNNHRDEAWPPGFDEAQGHYERMTGSMPHRALDMTRAEFQNGHAHAGRGLRKLWLTVQRTRIQETAPKYAGQIREEVLPGDHAQREASTFATAWFQGWRGPGLYAAPLELTIKKRLDR